MENLRKDPRLATNFQKNNSSAGFKRHSSSGRIFWLASFCLLASCDLNQSSQSSNGSLSEHQKSELKAHETLKKQCQDEAATLVSNAAKLTKSKLYDDAYKELEKCAFKAEVASIDEAFRSVDIAKAYDRLNKTSPKNLQSRFDALADLRTAMSSELPPKLNAEMESLTRLVEQRDQRAEKARKKKEGVVIGMTTQDVLDSQWGRPERKNVDTYSNSTKEQWVYPGGYLYFRDGILTSISQRN
jgi:hypothetical protein